MQTPAGYRFSKEAWAALPQDVRDQAKAYLLELAEKRTENPIAFYQPHPKQVGFHTSRARKRLFYGGNRSGKTTAGVVDNLIQALDESDVPEHLRQFKRWEPPFHCRIVIPDLGATLSDVHLQKLREWCPRHVLQGQSFERAWDKTNRVLHFENGSRFQYMSHEQDLDKFGGAALHRVHLDEEPPEGIFNECMMRLVDYGGDSMVTMTPTAGVSWIIERFYEPWEKAVDLGEVPDDPYVLIVDMDDNPHLNEAAKNEELAGLPADEREARKTGRPVHFAGLIYPEFDEDVHVIPELDELDPSWLTYEGIDPGWRHMCAILFCAMTPDGTFIVFDEITEPRKTVEVLAKEVHIRRERWNMHPEWSVIDPSARNKNNQTGRSDQMEWQEQGIFTVPGQNAVRPGINRVKQRLEKRPPKILICANCPTTRSQFKKYRWKSEKGRSKESAEQEQPIKRDDHTLDVIRYLLMSLPQVPDEEPEPDNRPFPVRMAEKALTQPKSRAAGEFGPGIYA